VRPDFNEQEGKNIMKKKKNLKLKLRDTKPAHDPKGGKHRHRHGNPGDDSGPSNPGPTAPLRHFLP